MAVAGLQHQRRRIARGGEQAGMAQRDEAAISDEDVERECEDREQQNLAGNVDVIRIADPDGQCDQRDESEGDGRALRCHCAHDTTRPNRPCGRNRKASRTSTQKTEPASTPQMRSPPPPPGPDDAQPDARTTTIAASTRSSPT